MHAKLKKYITRIHHTNVPFYEICIFGYNERKKNEKQHQTTDIIFQRKVFTMSKDQKIAPLTGDSDIEIVSDTNGCSR